MQDYKAIASWAYGHHTFHELKGFQLQLLSLKLYYQITMEVMSSDSWQRLANLGSVCTDLPVVTDHKHE